MDIWLSLGGGRAHLTAARDQRAGLIAASGDRGQGRKMRATPVGRPVNRSGLAALRLVGPQAMPPNRPRTMYRTPGRGWRRSHCPATHRGGGHSPGDRLPWRCRQCASCRRRRDDISLFQTRRLPPALRCCLGRKPIYCVACRAPITTALHRGCQTVHQRPRRCDHGIPRLARTSAKPIPASYQSLGEGFQRVAVFGHDGL